MTIPGLAPGVTVGAARRLIAAAFRASGNDTPDLDGRVLIGHALNLDHAALAANDRRKLAADEANAIDVLAARRLHGEPVARITGVKEFWGLPLRITAATLVPRPETETLVEAALAVTGHRRDTRLRIADFGTGSGALILALLSELPNAFGVATDISLAALQTARTNASERRLKGRAQFVACNFGAALDRGFDLVVVNPPYVASGDVPELPIEVRHDPPLALDGGPDGLAAYRAIAADAQRLLAPQGHMVVELGIGQEQAVTAIFEMAGLEILTVRPDLSGVARALTARVAIMPP